MILTQEYSRVANIYSGNRAWLISPDGGIHPCGNDHETYIYEHPEEFKGEATGLISSYALVQENWTRVGVIGDVFFVHIKDMLTERNLNLLKKLAKKTPISFKQVQIHKDSGSSIYFKPEEFQMVSLKDVNRRGVLHYSNKQASLPHSRDLLRHKSLEDLSYPLRKAFLLLDLENKYKSMSLNEITPILRKNERLLEDEIGWTSDELIRDINQLLE